MITLESHPDFCPVPWREMTIDPQGWLLICCQSTQGRVAHISEVEDLTDVFQGHYYQRIREQFLEGQIPSACLSCMNRDRRGIATLRTSRARDMGEFDARPRLEILEVDFSNLCNQQCVMCSSRYSTQWQQADSLARVEFARQSSPYHGLSDADVDKIIRILPQLRELQVKGGEPTIDPRFERVLDHLRPDQTLRIVTNLQQPRPRIFERLLSLPNLNLVISVDGTGQLYDWVRGGSWSKTRSNIERVLREARAERINITQSLSYWTLLSLPETLRELESLAAQADRSIGVVLRTVVWPEYASAEAVDPTSRAEMLSRIGTYPHLKITGLEQLSNLKYRPELGERCEAWQREVTSLRSPKGGAQIL